MSILIAIILFSIIVIFHELGHFLLAKVNGIRVNEFSLGLGPTIIGFTKGETKYSLKLLPFGGACMMEGEDDESNDERAFGKKGVWARISVVFAGPFFNFIMAFVFAVIIIFSIGYDDPVLTDVMDGFPAQEAGLQGGDRIVKMNGHTIHFYREVSLYSALNSGESVDITYIRDGKKDTVTVTPKYDEENKAYYYGIIGSTERVKKNIGDSLVHGVYEVKYWVWYTVESLKLLVTGSVSLNELSGPVGIVKSVSQTYNESASEAGYFAAFINMLRWGIILSANLGVMNLLPLPALDGGRLVFLIIEAIRRKKIDPQKEAYVHAAGIVILLGLMVLVMFNDIRKLFI